MRLGGLVFVVVLAGCTLDFDGVGPGEEGAGGAGVAGGPSAGKGQGGDAGQPGSGGANAGGSNTAGSNAGGAASCDADNGGCVEQPVGFSGLIELREGTACSGNPVFSGGLSGAPFTALAATCGCACVFNDDVCGQVDVWSGNLCDGLNASVMASPSGCTVLPNPGGQSPHSVLIDLGTQPGASCKTNGAGFTKDPVSFNEPVNACAIETSPACGDTEVCVPADGGSYCLVAAGATTCPPGIFANEKRLLSPSDFLDDRACSCVCGSTLGQVTCTAPVGLQLHEGNNCMGAGATLIQFPGCFAADEAESLSFMPDINGTCTPASENATGAAAPIAGAGQLLCCNTP